MLGTSGTVQKHPSLSFYQCPLVLEGAVGTLQGTELNLSCKKTQALDVDSTEMEKSCIMATRSPRSAPLQGTHLQAITRPSVKCAYLGGGGTGL